MPINSSQIIDDSPQHDGRRYVTELHTDHLAQQYRIIYLCTADFDAAAAMSARVASILERLAERELDDNEQRAMEGDFQPPTFNHCTPLQLRNRLREVFRTVKGFVACRLAWYIEQLNLTDNQYKQMFGVNDAQLVLLKVKISRLADRYEAAQSEDGE